MLIEDNSVNKMISTMLPVSQTREVERQAKAAGVPKSYVYRHAMEHGLLHTAKLFGVEFKKD